MLGAYASILRAPGAVGLVALSLAARLSFGLFDFAVVVLVQRETGSFALAGLVIGAHAAGIATTAPVRGRLLDRYGAGRILPGLALIHASCTVALVAASGGGSIAATTTFAFLGGALVPPLVPAMRLEWQRLLEPGSAALETAYAFETSAQIGVFLVGPLLTTAALISVGPKAPLLLGAVLVATAGPLFASRARAQPVAGAATTRGLGSIAIPGLRTLIGVVVLADAALGTVDVAIVAVAVDAGHPAAAGVLVAVFTASAVVGAAVYGTRSWTQPPRRRLAVVLGMFTCSLALLSLSGPLLIFAALLIPAGAASAAQWTTTSVLLDSVAPTSQAAEAFTWMSSANAAGIAVGGVVAGIVVDAHGAKAAFAVAAALAASAAVTLLARDGSFRTSAAGSR